LSSCLDLKHAACLAGAAFKRGTRGGPRFTLKRRSIAWNGRLASRLQHQVSWRKRGWRFALLLGDAAMPFRTSSTIAPAYRSEYVAEAIDEDFAAHGAPLVLRLDRHATHLTDDVARVLDKHQVLALHGPPHHPGYYGQRERQIRDDRSFVVDDIVDDYEAAFEISEARRCLNELKPRRSLDWCTPSQAWMNRPILDVNREEFRRAVAERADGLRPQLSNRARSIHAEECFAPRARAHGPRAFDHQQRGVVRNRPANDPPVT
jgi:hypothetical protein